MGPGFEPQGGHHRECELECENANPSNSNSHSHCFSPGAEIGRQAWLRAMCPLGRAGSTPALGTKTKAETGTTKSSQNEPDSSKKFIFRLRKAKDVFSASYLLFVETKEGASSE